MNIFKDILSFIFSKFKIFIVILLILATAPYVWGEILNELENREILLEKATELKEVHENIPKTLMLRNPKPRNALVN